VFLAAKVEFDARVSELQAMSADHFGAKPEALLPVHASISPAGSDGCGT
jgi:hypothetical protein